MFIWTAVRRALRDSKNRKAAMELLVKLLRERVLTSIEWGTEPYYSEKCHTVCWMVLVFPGGRYWVETGSPDMEYLRKDEGTSSEVLALFDLAPKQLIWPLVTKAAVLLSENPQFCIETGGNPHSYGSLKHIPEAA